MWPLNHLTEKEKNVKEMPIFLLHWIAAFDKSAVSLRNAKMEVKQFVRKQTIFYEIGVKEFMTENDVISKLWFL